MAKWMRIELLCGHTEKHRLYGMAEEQDVQEQKIAARKCSACIQAEQNAERDGRNATNAAENAAAGLPALEGTPKQIAWAETIRAEARRGFEALDVSHLDYEWWDSANQSPRTRARAEQLIRDDIARTMARTQAAWWIEVGRLYTLEWTEERIHEHLQCPAQEILWDEIDRGLFD